MTDLHQTYYRQVKNPNPVFTPREGAGTLKFCEKLMEKAVGFTSRFDFAIHVAHARSRGLRRRMPPVLRRRAIDALLQGLCFHYDPLANRVQCSITTLAIECGLATESAAGKLSITRATRALTFLSELGLIPTRRNMTRLSGATFRPISRSHLHCLLPSMYQRRQWPPRAAAVWYGKTNNAKSRGWIPWAWMN